MGDSPQERSFADINKNVKNLNIDQNLPNIIGGFKYPYSTERILGAVDDSTKSATNLVRKDTMSDVSRAAKSIATRYKGAGVNSGSILDDAIAKATEGIRETGSNTVGKIQSNSIGLKPGIMQQGNMDELNLTKMKQNFWKDRLSAIFQKYNTQMGASSGMSNTSTFEDIMSGIDFFSTLASQFAGQVGGSGGGNMAAMAL